MTRISATIVGDSLSPQGHQLSSLICTFPKYLLAEAKTHRVISQDSNEVEIQQLDVSFNADKNLSRNSASSRAIPTHRLLKQVKEDPFIPIAWQKEHKGMQGKEYVTNPLAIGVRNGMWLDARDHALKIAEMLSSPIVWNSGSTNYEPVELTQAGEDGEPVSKQMANRLLEPFLWTTVLVSATEWQNFFELRCPQYLGDSNGIYFKSWKDFTKYRVQHGASETALNNTNIVDRLVINKGQAEIHIMALAECIWDALNESTPRQLQPGEWHIPFGDRLDIKELYNANTGDNPINDIVKISTAMAARTSYTVVGDEKEISYERLIAIHDRLISAKPLHASPMEHCARAMSDDEYDLFTHEQPMFPDMPEGRHATKEHGWCRNFRGFISYRHLIE